MDRLRDLSWHLHQKYPTMAGMAQDSSTDDIILHFVGGGKVTVDMRACMMEMRYAEDDAAMFKVICAEVDRYLGEKK